MGYELCRKQKWDLPNIWENRKQGSISENGLADVILNGNDVIEKLFDFNKIMWIQQKLTLYTHNLIS